MRAGLRARPVLCRPGCGRDQCCAGRAAGETSAVRGAAGGTSAVRAGLRAIIIAVRALLVIYYY